MAWGCEALQGQARMVLSMQAALEEILALQNQWTDKNTAHMQRRGVLVRRELTAWLNDRLPSVRASHRTLTDLAVDPSDGSGRKAAIPWCRIHSINRSPTATQGWYLVYLFSADGAEAYLSLNQATNRRKNRRNVGISDDVLTARVEWARKVLQLSERQDLEHDISLETPITDLGRQYGLGNVVAFAYSAGSVPDESELTNHLLEMTSWLASLHEAEETSLDIPGEPAPEVADAQTVIGQSASSSRRARQGFRLNTAKKLATEQRAVDVATDHFKKSGFRVRYVGASEPFDLEVKKGGETLSVEVKGTTSAGSEVILTRGEVEHHWQIHPHNALAIVHSIELDRSGSQPRAIGGQLKVQSPWQIEELHLTPLAFKYTTGL